MLNFLIKRIFKPLGMTSTRLISERDIIPNRAAGYELDNGQLKNQEWVSPTFNSTADGTLYFNVLDLAKWDNALYGVRLLKQSSLDRIWSVYPLNDGKPNPAGYGFGWSIGEQNKHKRISHNGAWQGFTCSISRYPDDNLTTVVLTNLDSGHSDPDLIARVVAGLADSPLLPSKLTAIPDTEPAIATSLQKLLDQLVKGEDIRPQATAELAARMTAERVKAAQRTLSTVWPGARLTLVKRNGSSASTGSSVSMFRLNKDADAILIRFGLNSHGKIAILGLSPDRDYE